MKANHSRGFRRIISIIVGVALVIVLNTGIDNAMKLSATSQIHSGQVGQSEQAPAPQPIPPRPVRLSGQTDQSEQAPAPQPIPPRPVRFSGHIEQTEQAPAPQPIPPRPVR